MPIVTFADQPEPNEVTYAEGRLTTRTYASRSFTMQFGRDRGHPARYVQRVFDEVVTEDDDDWEWTNDVVYTTPGGRKQLELQVAREAGAVRKLRIQKVPTSGDLTRLESVLELNREQATSLIDMLRAIDAIPIEGESTVHVDDQLLRDVFADPTAVASVYANRPRAVPRTHRERRQRQRRDCAPASSRGRCDHASMVGGRRCLCGSERRGRWP